MVLTRHLIAAMTTVLTVSAIFVALTSPLALVFLIDENDLTGWGGAALWIAGIACGCCLVFAPIALSLERVVQRGHRAWVVLVPTVPIGAVAVAMFLAVALFVVVPHDGGWGTATAGAVLFLISAALYWSVLWLTHATGFVVGRLRRIQTGEPVPIQLGRATLLRHMFSLAVTCAFPPVLVLVLTLPVIAVFAVIDLLSSGHTGFGDPGYWLAYLEVLLGAAGVGLVAGVLLLPFAWAFERLVLRRATAWGVLAVWAPAGSVAASAALIFLGLTVGFGAGVLDVPAAVVALLGFFFPVYWCALWLWQGLAAGGRLASRRPVRASARLLTDC
jgi:hypothetical protein